MNIIINYVPGSGGELLSNPLIKSGLYISPIKSHNLSSSGRMIPTLNKKFIKKFPNRESNHHFSRDWSKDYSLLDKYSKNWLLLIVDDTQSCFLKEKFSDNALVISITYTQNELNFVLNSFCHKVLDSKNYLTKTANGKEFLNAAGKTPEQKEELIQLAKNGGLGNWYKQNYWNNHIFFPPKKYNFKGDFEVNLKDLLIPDGLEHTYWRLSSKINMNFDYSKINNLHSKWLQANKKFIDAK